MDICALFRGCTLTGVLHQSPTELFILYSICFEILHLEFQQVFAFSSPMRAQGMSAQCMWCPIPSAGGALLCQVVFSFQRVHLRCPCWERQQRGQQPGSGLGWRRTWEGDSCNAIHHQEWAVSIRSCSLCLLPKSLRSHPTVLDKTPNRQTLPSVHQCGILTSEFTNPPSQLVRGCCHVDVMLDLLVQEKWVY